MAYLSPYTIPPVYTGPAPRIVCPHKRVMNFVNCLNCSYGGVPITKEIHNYLEYLLVRARNDKKLRFLSESGE